MSLLFALFALASCLGAVAVVVSQSVVRMAFWLIVSLGSVAGLFFLCDADFVGAAQLLIYVGGTLVLLVFGVMLTASGPYLKIETSPAQTIVAGLVGLLFLFMVVATVSEVDWSGTKDRILSAGGHYKSASQLADARFDDASEGNTLRPLGLALLGVRTDLPGAPGYLLPFEIASVHLLVVLVGAAYLARAKRRRDTV
ncbi:MAG: NADH-quinone oxidoreductase subunit J [Planctomycetaceae bacterium]